MSIASDKLETIRQQVQYHLDHEAQKQLSPAQENELRERGLHRGEFIMTGTCGGLIPLEAGDRAEADFGVLGKVRLTVGRA